MNNEGTSGGIKYRENWHNFRGSVAGFAGSGIVATLIIHWVVLTSPAGHAKWMHILGPVVVGTGMGH
jgi:hypothetical protein